MLWPIVLLIVSQAPEMVAATGEHTVLTLKPHHRLRLPRELPDTTLTEGRHRLAELAPLRDPGPLFLVTESRLDARDGQIQVLGLAGQALEGPKSLSYFAWEPFPSAVFPADRLRTVTDQGEPLAVVQTLEALVLERDEASLWVVGLDPTAEYRLTVADETAAFVLVAADLNLAAASSSQAANEAWGRSRLVLSGGQSAELPPTDRIALTVAQTSTAGRSPLSLTLERVKPGKGSDTVRPLEVGSRWKAFAYLVGDELLRRRDASGALHVSEQCLRLDSRDARCNLMNARATAGTGSREQAVEKFCQLIRLSPDTAEAAEARKVLGKIDCSKPASEAFPRRRH